MSVKIKMAEKNTRHFYLTENDKRKEEKKTILCRILDNLQKKNITLYYLYQFTT